MTLAELKKYITDKSIPSDFLIIVTKDNKFLARQYLDALKKVASVVNNITSIYEPQQSSMIRLVTDDSCLNLLNVEEFAECAEDYSQFKNTVVFCEQIDKTIEAAVASFVIKLPVLKDWQVLDYAKTVCCYTDEAELKTLITAVGGDTERLYNELSKAAVFEGEQQKAVISQLINELVYELYNPELFSIVNALVDCDMPVLYDFMYHRYAGLDPVVLANRTFNSLKNIILISQNPQLTHEDLNISAGQVKFIRYKYRSLNMFAAQKKLKFLVNFDLDLKTSKLDLAKEDMLSYLISNLAYKIT